MYFSFHKYSNNEITENIVTVKRQWRTLGKKDTNLI